jgi:NAD(P)-dependent dehydrogenase (short-subunit alcohol dehydrogenase family)
VGVDIDLSGRRALVTGGGNGVGTEICAALVRAGAFVWVNDIYEDRAVAVAADLGGDEHARAVKADVTSPLKITRMREATGPIDILVNNAGIPTSGLAAEVGAHGVTVNCVSLGTMKTGPTEDAVARNPGLEAKLARPYPIPRLGRPEDPALLVALLCSDAGSWITGQVYPVDGGYSPTL